jgi:hypothetical protein
VAQWAKAETFPAGMASARQFQLGPEARGAGILVPIGHGSVRVGFEGHEQAPENFLAELVLPDQGQVIGPIDLPCELTVELPVLVRVWPEAAPAADRRVVVTASTPPLKARWSATRRVYLLTAPAYQVIPQWVHSVSCCEVDAAVSLFDALGNLLCAFTGPRWDVPRPRLAVLISTTAAPGTAVLCSYQA